MTVGSGKEALNLLANERFQLIISDMRMPEMDGAEFLGRVKAEWPDTVRILLTGYSEMEATVKAINDGGIFSYLSNPGNGKISWPRLSVRPSTTSCTAIARFAWSRPAAKRRRWKTATKPYRRNWPKQKTPSHAAKRSSTWPARKSNWPTTRRLRCLPTSSTFKTPGETGINREVAQCAQFLATIMGLPATEQRNVRLAGMLYNVGKIGLASDLTSRPENQLNDREQQLFRRYPKLG